MTTRGQWAQVAKEHRTENRQGQAAFEAERVSARQDFAVNASSERIETSAGVHLRGHGRLEAHVAQSHPEPARLWQVRSRSDCGLVTTAYRRARAPRPRNRRRPATSIQFTYSRTCPKNAISRHRPCLPLPRRCPLSSLFHLQQSPRSAIFAGPGRRHSFFSVLLVISGIFQFFSTMRSSYWSPHPRRHFLLGHFCIPCPVFQSKWFGA